MEISKEELQNLLAAAIAAGVAESKKMNPLEEEEFKKQMELKRRRDMMQVEMGRIEEEAAKRKRYGCSHSRYANGHKLAGHPCPKGQGEWVTNGQMHSKGVASLICQRCGTAWIFRPDADEVQAIIDGGLSGMAPPDDSKCLGQRCSTCNEFFTPGEYESHNKVACKAKYEHIPALA